MIVVKLEAAGLGSECSRIRNDVVEAQRNKVEESEVMEYLSAIKFTAVPNVDRLSRACLFKKGYREACSSFI